MRSLVRLCPQHTYPPNNNNNKLKGRGHSSSDSPPQTPNYYYEATDLEHFTVYENNVRENGKTFECKHIYDSSATQFDIFANEVVPLIEKCLLGQDCALLFFGSDNAGKRFSLEGLPEYPGFFYRTMELLFDTLGKDFIHNILSLIPSKAGEDPSNKCRLFYSSFTIEKETLFDNLSPTIDSNSQIKLRDDRKKGIIAEGGTLIELYDIQQALQIYYESTSKFYKSLALSQNKHLVINIRIDISNACKSNFSKGEYGILSMVSVGSPTTKPTVITAEKTQELEVANFWVNHLGSCMNSLHNSTNPSIPFHKSKFTLLLRDYLLGTKDSTALFNLSPLYESYKFVIQTLTICNRIAKTTSVASSKSETLKRPTRNNIVRANSNQTTEKSKSINPTNSDLEKKTQEVEVLTKENRDLSEKMKSIEEQLKKIQENQEKQTVQINALSPTKPKDFEPVKVPKKMSSSKSLLNTSGNVIEIDRYREVMEGTISKLKLQIKSLESENIEVKKEMTKREGAFKKKISELVTDVKRDSYQKHIQELQLKVETLTKTVHQLKSQKKSITESEKNYRTHVEKLTKENQDLKQKLGMAQSIASSVVDDTSSTKSVTSEEDNIETDNEAYLVNEEEYEVHSNEEEEDDSSEFMNEVLPAEKSENERKLEREVILLKEALAVALSQKQQASGSNTHRGGFRISNVQPPFLMKK